LSHKPIISYNTATGPIIYDGCKYQKYEGLAEVSSFRVIQSAKNSTLGYDEYEIRYTFTPIDTKTKQLPEMYDQPFVLRDGTFEYAANKEYIDKYALLVGTKVPMTFWLIKKGTCTPNWYYSTGMPNDLSVFGDNLLEFKNKELQRRMEAGNKVAEQTNETIQASMPQPTITQNENVKPRIQPSVTTPKISQEVELKPKENITFDDKYKEADPTKNAKYNAASGDGGEVSTIQIESSTETATTTTTATTEPVRDNTTSKPKPLQTPTDNTTTAPQATTTTTTTLPTPTSNKEAVRMARERRELALKKQYESELKQQKEEQQRLKTVASNLNNKTKSATTTALPTIARPTTAPLNCNYTLEEEGTLKIIEVQKISATELKIVVKFTPNNPQAISSGYWFKNKVYTLNGINPSNEFVRKNKLYNGVEFKATAAMGEGNCPPKFVSPSIQE
jgi:flagellar basal body rod protein FlgC